MPPVNAISSLLDLPDGKVGKTERVITGPKKWKRVWLLDPLLDSRQSYLTKWIANKEAKNRAKDVKEKPFVRCLLFCWEVTARYWLMFLKKSGIECKEADIKSL